MARRNNSAAEYYGWFDTNPATGTNYYRIRVVDKNGEFKYTRVVKITLGKGEPSITVYPNPVQGKQMNVLFTSLDKGRYSLLLYNTAGQQIFVKTIEHSGGSVNYGINVEKVVTKGNYKLVITNGDKELGQSVIFE